MTTSFSELEGPAKTEMIVSMAALVLEECGQDFSVEKFESVLSASGNEVPSYWLKVFSVALTKKGSLDSFLGQPGGGGGGGGGGGAAAGGAAEEAKAEEKEEEEEEEVDMGGGMDMFGDDGGGDDY